MGGFPTMLSSILLVQAGSDMGLQNISSIKASAAWGLHVKLNVTTKSQGQVACTPEGGPFRAQGVTQINFA